MAQFATLLKQTKGVSLDKIKRTCKFLADGRVDIPVMYR
jgi:hypothetical protein